MEGEAFQIIKGHAKEDIWNIWMKQECFGRLYLIVVLGSSVLEARNVSVTVAAKEKPILLWKSENPRCVSSTSRDIMEVESSYCISM